MGDHPGSLAEAVVEVFLLKKLINVFMSALGLRCSLQAFASCGTQGLTLGLSVGFPITVASRCRAQALGCVPQ